MCCASPALTLIHRVSALAPFINFPRLTAANWSEKSLRSEGTACTEGDTRARRDHAVGVYIQYFLFLLCIFMLPSFLRAVKTKSATYNTSPFFMRFNNHGQNRYYPLLLKYMREGSAQLLALNTNTSS